MEIIYINLAAMYYIFSLLYIFVVFLYPIVNWYWLMKCYCFSYHNPNSPSPLNFYKYI